MFRSFTVALTATSFLVFPVAPASAGNSLGRALVGAGALAIIGCASGALRCGNNNRAQTQKRVFKQKRQPSQAEIAQRAENKAVQNALNAFGFNVGGADGVLGRNSQRGISEYQSSLGYPATGALDDQQTQFLLDSHLRIAASGGYGNRDTLRQFHNEQNYNTAGNGYGGNGGGYNPGGYDNGQNTLGAGNGYADPYANQFAGDAMANAGPIPTAPQVVTPGGTEIANAAAGSTLLPTLKPNAGGLKAGGSMADRCELVDLLTQSNGVTLASNIVDPDQALSEQFCDMRTDAMATGQQIMVEYGVDAERMRDEICGPIALEMSEAIGSATAQGPQQVSAQAAQTTRNLGISDADQARDYGRMCLAVGYRLDEPELAMGGAMMMIGQSDYAYSEVVGHHLREGFGADADSNAAEPWYRTAIAVLDQGGQPAFLISQSANRAAVMRGALDLGATRAANGSLPGVVAVNTGPVLPILKRQ